MSRSPRTPPLFRDDYRWHDSCIYVIMRHTTVYIRIADDRPATVDSNERGEAIPAEDGRIRVYSSRRRRTLTPAQFAAEYRSA